MSGNLFAYWRGQFDSFCCAAVLKMVFSCPMWCIWREINNCSFEDRVRTMMELKAVFFNTLYHWMTAFDCFYDFLDLLSFSS
jgi:hypothetical protein